MKIVRKDSFLTKYYFKLVVFLIIMVSIIFLTLLLSIIYADKEINELSLYKGIGGGRLTRSESNDLFELKKVLNENVEQSKQKCFDGEFSSRKRTNECLNMLYSISSIAFQEYCSSFLNIIKEYSPEYQTNNYAKIIEDLFTELDAFFNAEKDAFFKSVKEKENHIKYEREYLLSLFFIKNQIFVTTIQFIKGKYHASKQKTKS